MGAEMRIEVPDISCDHCKSSIEGALAEVEGVAGAEVDVAARVVTVRVDDVNARRPAVVSAIEAQGYEVPGAHGARPAEGAEAERPGRGELGQT
mgnify:FL=1